MKKTEIKSELVDAELESNIADSEFQNGDWEHDPVWDMLKNSEPIRASAGFVDRVVHAIREEPSKTEIFWTGSKKYVAALLTAAACLVAYVMTSYQPRNDSSSNISHAEPQVTTPAEAFADLQEQADQEMLLAAVDHLNDFSDTELVTLIGL